MKARRHRAVPLRGLGKPMLEGCAAPQIIHSRAKIGAKGSAQFGFADDLAQVFRHDQTREKSAVSVQ